MYGQTQIARRRTNRRYPSLGQIDIAKAVAGLASSQVKGGFFRSQISPDIRLDPLEVMSGTARTFGQGGVSEMFLNFAKPAVYLDTSFGSLKIAPWGEPKFNYFPLLILGTAVGGAVVAGMIWKQLKKRTS